MTLNNHIHIKLAHKWAFKCYIIDCTNKTNVPNLSLQIISSDNVSNSS